MNLPQDPKTRQFETWAYETEAAQEEAKRAAGRYTLEEAAAKVESEAGEQRDGMLAKFVEAVATGTLPAFAPGQRARMQYERSPVREFYDEVHWDDLNGWLENHEPRIRYRFPPPPNPVNDFWWMVYDRRDFLQRKNQDWEGNEHESLAATKEEKLALINMLLDGIDDLLDHHTSLDRDPKELSILKHWYAGATKRERQSWIEFIPLSPPAESWQSLRPISTVTLGLDRSVNGRSDTPRPVPRWRSQEEGILNTLRELGYDPGQVPRAPSRGQHSPAKQAVRSKLPYSHDVFNKAWQRLRDYGRIKDAPP